MASPRDPESGGMRQKLLDLMTAEILSEQPMETFSNHEMARGKEVEPKAIDYYAFQKGVEPRRVAFVRRTIAREFSGDLVIGCSPDALIGNDGGLEVKRMRADLAVELLRNGAKLGKHKAQVQGSLLVTGREWWDLMVYPDPVLSVTPPSVRLYRDEPYLAAMLNEIDRFTYDLQQAVDDLRKRG